MCRDRSDDDGLRLQYCVLLARTMGLRIHETTKIDRNDAVKALATGRLGIIGKNGKPRTVPLSPEGRGVLEEVIKHVPRGEKLFVKSDEETHDVIKMMQNTINKTRELWENQRDPSAPHRTFHGLRHCYAQEQYEQCIAEGLVKRAAEIKVSKLLGHERAEITRIYLGVRR